MGKTFSQYQAASSSTMEHQAFVPGEDRMTTLRILEEKDNIYKVRIRRLRFVSRIASSLLSGYMIGSLSYSLAQYYLTRTKVVPGIPNQRAWAEPTVLWPTFMLLSIASLTFMTNVITMCAYICSVKAANRTSSLASYIAYAGFFAHFVAWAVSMGLYQLASQAAQDLWGYSCSEKADVIQPDVQSFIDFGKLCTVQTGAWYSSILEAANYFLVAVTMIFVFRRNRHQQKLKKAIAMNEVDLATMAPYKGYDQGFGYSAVTPHV